MTRTFTPASFDIQPSERIDWGAVENTYFPFWTNQDGAFNVPPNLPNKTLNLRMVRKTDTDIRKFFFMPEGDDDEVRQSILGERYRLFSQPVKVFPLLPNADSTKAGIFIGIQKIETDGKISKTALRTQGFDADLAIAITIATKLNKPVSVRIIYIPDSRYPEKIMPRLAGGDFMKGEVYPPTEADAGRVPVSDTKAQMVAGMEQAEFFDFLVRTKKMVDVPLDNDARKINVVQELCNAHTS